VDKSAIKRWAVLLSIAAVTAVASFYPANELVVSPKARYRPPKSIAVPSGPLPASAPALSAASVSSPGGDPDGESPDPFAPRGWQPPPPPEPAKPPPAIVQAQVAPPPAGPPPLPFKFMGRLDGGAEGGQQTIYLSKGEQTFVPQVGDTLEDIYKVLRIDADHIEFEHLPTGEKQTLTIPAPEK